MFGLFKRKSKEDRLRKPDSLDLDGNAFPEFGDSFVEQVRKQNYLIHHSSLHEVFRSSKPITDQTRLVGREEILWQANQVLQAEGAHVILFGDRGVGKSSIGNVLLDVFKRSRVTDEKLFIYRCNERSQLMDMVAGILLYLDLDIDQISHSSRIRNETGKDVDAEIGFPGLSIHAGTQIIEAIGSDSLRVGVREKANDPSWVAQQIHGLDALVFIDELDKVADPSVKHALATLVKAVSDYRDSKLNFVLAGIAQNAAELTAGHPSVQRCLKEIPVGRLKEKSLIEIIETGEQRLKSWDGDRWRPLTFDDDVKGKIAQMSFGYPYFTQLLATHAAQSAVLANASDVTMNMLSFAVKAAVNDAEDDLKKALRHALRADDSSMYRNLLRSAAEVTATTITAQELREALSDRIGEKVSQQKINPYLKRLVSDKPSVEAIMEDLESPKPIFVRISDATYRFYDPRMPSYIRLALSGSNDQTGDVPLLDL